MLGTGWNHPANIDLRSCEAAPSKAQTTQGFPGCTTRRGTGHPEKSGSPGAVAALPAPAPGKSAPGHFEASQFPPKASQSLCLAKLHGEDTLELYGHTARRWTTPSAHQRSQRPNGVSPQAPTHKTSQTRLLLQPRTGGKHAAPLQKQAIAPKASPSQKTQYPGALFQHLPAFARSEATQLPAARQQGAPPLLEGACTGITLILQHFKRSHRVRVPWDTCKAGMGSSQEATTGLGTNSALRIIPSCTKAKWCPRAPRAAHQPHMPRGGPSSAQPPQQHHKALLSRQKQQRETNRDYLRGRRYI